MTINIKINVNIYINLDSILSVLLKILSVIIHISSSISLRSSLKIINIIGNLYSKNFTNKNIYHFTSIANLTNKYGLYLLNSVKNIEEKWVAIIDITVDSSIKKILTILRVPLSSIRQNSGALSLKNCECIGLKIFESCNGDIIFNALKEIFEKIGIPIAILVDGGSDLEKGLKLLRLYFKKQNNKTIQIIRDIGHIVSNALKAEYKKNKQFKNLLSLLNEISKKLRQSKYNYLLPPKLRKKGRFQSVTVVAKWINNILKYLNNKEYASILDIPDEYLEMFERLNIYKDFLYDFINICDHLEQILKVCKCRGLNQSSYKEINILIEQIPKSVLIRNTLKKWLNDHIRKHCLMSISQENLPVSTDCIESLFGKFKYISQMHSNSGFTTNSLILPCLCGEISVLKIINSIKEIQIKDLK